MMDGLILTKNKWLQRLRVCLSGGFLPSSRCPLPTGVVVEMMPWCSIAVSVGSFAFVVPCLVPN
jgi:hypothetical protein